MPTFKLPDPHIASEDEGIQRNFERIERFLTELGSRFFWGEGDPENVVAAPVGAVYFRLDGGAATTLYVKESGTGDTGWDAK